jgi:hypothetical protein
VSAITPHSTPARSARVKKYGRFAFLGLGAGTFAYSLVLLGNFCVNCAFPAQVASGTS